MNIVEIIEKKKNKQELTRNEIHFFVKGVTSGEIEDYQTSALLMAICINGMNEKETFDLTMAMRDSGEVLDLSSIGRTIVDKHSTGGVGDKTTLIVGPIMASLDIPVAKMSGRGLGITGGTIDKLESIPGFSSEVSDEQFIEQVHTIGMVDAAQNKNLAPADKKLYALRDVTGTVDSIPLIASSIMSKKLASGADSIVLDVKCGSGAFMRNTEDAEKLASAMIDIAKKANKKCEAVISDMDQPLGYAVGNQLEVEEAVRFLSGVFREKRLESLVIGLCKAMYKLSDKYYGQKDEEIERFIRETLDSGNAFNKFKQFVAAQGGDVDFIDELYKAMGDNMGYKGKSYTITTEDVVKNPDDVYGPLRINRIDAGLIGKSSLALGAGRMRKEDAIDPGAGLVFNRFVGDELNPGDEIVTLYSLDDEKLKAGRELCIKAIELG